MIPSGLSCREPQQPLLMRNLAALVVSMDPAAFTVEVPLVLIGMDPIGLPHRGYWQLLPMSYPAIMVTGDSSETEMLLHPP
ncbi:hypothetical protein P7K49_039209 [Saguinus oedipus]|uniref:Uncharacterized protein n=1 Tax=Saguinus oedipus TaxID=9490 RepID=A0ABQ9TGT9_SAGOE|nr:hypothetical protein P7K49_039209 [Saguinus oedipus]